MSITSGLVLFAIIWFVILFMVLPLRVTSQEEAGEVEPGTPASAPDEPMIRKKVVWTSIAAAICWLIAFAVVESHVITIDDMAALTGYDVEYSKSTAD